MAFANYRKKSAQMAHMKAQQNKVNNANAAADDDVDDNEDEDVKPCPTPAGRRWLALSEHSCWPRSARPL